MQNKDLSQILSSVLKAFDKNEDLNINFVERENNYFQFNQNYIENNSIKLPESSDIKDIRGISDLAICYLIFHDKNIHNKFLAKVEIEEQELINNFEKLRLIAKMKNNYRGVAKNIFNKLSQDIELIDIDNDFLKFQFILFHYLFSDETLANENIKKIAQDFLINQEEEINHKILKIAQNYQDQEKFSEKIIELLDFLKKENNKKDENKKEEQKEESKQNKQENKDERNDNNENLERQNQETKTEESEEKSSEKSLKEEIKKSDSTPAKVESRSDFSQKIENEIEFKNIYKIFNNKFDEIIIPNKLIDKYELEFLRQKLQKKLDEVDKISKRLSAKLKKKLLSKKYVAIEQSESEDVIDRKKLTQIILNPFERNFYIQDRKNEYQNIIVTILIDNSGSMRGNPIIMAALACEILSNILEKFNIKTEILGFTTADWKGGKSRKLWERQGKISNPGRLNDLRHIIYKSANQNFKKAKINLGLMLKEGILKENIDGEALLWAKSRLMQREEERKILMVISDGTPVDDSTNSFNDKDILIDHLNHVISRIEKENKIELVGIGIGHNVGEFYKNSITIKNAEDLGDVMIEKLLELI